MVPSPPHFGFALRGACGLAVKRVVTTRNFFDFHNAGSDLDIRHRSSELPSTALKSPFADISRSHFGIPPLRKETAMTSQNAKPGQMTGQMTGFTANTTGGLSEKRVINYTSRYF